MEQISIFAQKISQPIGEYYIGKSTALNLLKICKFDFRRMSFSNGYMDFLGIQRQVSEKRANEIARYAGTIDAVFPTAVVISIPQRCVSVTPRADGLIDELSIHSYVNLDSPELSISLDEVASIIDGQHRLKGIENSKDLNVELPVAIFVDLDPATEASIFSVVNLAQTKVNKSLVYDLFALAHSRSPEKTCHEVVVALDRMDVSPFRSRIKRLGRATEGRFGETLSQATMVRGLLPYITSDALADRDRGKRFGFWDPIVGPESRRRIFYEFFRNNEDERILATVLNYFNAIAEKIGRAHV